jgi:hypothetical protein
MLRRRGRVRPEDLLRLEVLETLDVQHLKIAWNAALASAEQFAKRHQPEEAGCLYYSMSEKQFVAPDNPLPAGVVLHFGGPCGVLPRVLGD